MIIIGASLVICGLIHNEAQASNSSGELTPLLDQVVVVEGNYFKNGAKCIYDLYEDVEDVIFAKVDSNRKYSILPLMLASKKMFRDVNRYLLKRLLTEWTFKSSRFMMESGAYRMALLEDIAGLPFSPYRYTKDLTFWDRQWVLHLLRSLGYGEKRIVKSRRISAPLAVKISLASLEGKILLTALFTFMLWFAGSVYAANYLLWQKFVGWTMVLATSLSGISIALSLIMIILSVCVLFALGECCRAV